MKIYTKTGDTGSTSLVYGKRVSKSDLRLEAYGTVDELNAQIGLLRALWKHEDDLLPEIQQTLFALGAILATPEESPVPVSPDDVIITKMEVAIDEMTLHLPPLQSFILPSGGTATATCHVARTVCRRAERHVVALYEQHPANPFVLSFLNRLSDYLFVLSRFIAFEKGETEEIVIIR